MSLTFSWPEGKAGALTTSWDDGTIHDRRLVSILNAHGLKGSFHLNAAKFGQAASSTWYGYVTPEEVPGLYAGHEISAHSFTHPHLTRIPAGAVRGEMVRDRLRLEELAGYPVVGMSLPFGAYDARVNELLRECGMEYSRTTKSHGAFHPPADFLEWHPTCHHKADLPALWTEFLANKAADKLFYLWGHSYEFDRDNNWEILEKFAAVAGQEATVWQATNQEICEYLRAWRELLVSLDSRRYRNRSGLTIWARQGQELKSIPPGGSLSLA